MFDVDEVVEEVSGRAWLMMCKRVGMLDGVWLRTGQVPLEMILSKDSASGMPESTTDTDEELSVDPPIDFGFSSERTDARDGDGTKEGRR